jgi:membrane fusion protein (multidrug efflux system)
MIKRLVIVVLALAILFGGIFGWKAYVGYQMRKAIASAQPPAVVVSSARVEEGRWQASVTSVGSLRANQGVEVSAEVAGTVAGIAFESGGRVAAGDLLVQLDASKEEADLRSLEAQLELARLDYERARSLLRSTAVSQSQLDRAKSVLDSLGAQADAQRATIAKKAIRAPFPGELGIRQVDLGQYLSAGSEIVTLQSLDPIFVDFTVPERHLPALAVGQQIEIEVAAFPGQSFVGSVSAISPKVEEETRNVLLRATLANPEGRLRPGMFARVAVLTGGLDRVLTLPRSAISFFPYGDSVFVIQGQGEDLVVERRQVTTGRIRDGRVEIVDGLAAGDQVVSAGQLKLRTGQRIRVDNSVVLPSGVTRG